MQKIARYHTMTIVTAAMRTTGTGFERHPVARRYGVTKFARNSHFIYILAR